MVPLYIARVSSRAYPSPQAQFYRVFRKASFKTKICLYLERHRVIDFENILFALILFVQYKLQFSGTAFCIFGFFFIKILLYLPRRLKKTSRNNSNTVLVIQRRGRVVTDYKNRQKFSLCIKINEHQSNQHPKVLVRSFRPV